MKYSLIHTETKEFSIENIKIGGNNNPLIIPEIGINHEGSLSVACEMVLSASRAGAKIIKHQTHVVDDEMSHLAKSVVPGNADVSIYDIMKRCALNEEEELELKRYTEELGMVFLSTPFSRAAARRLKKFGVSAFKIGSGELNNYPLIEEIAEYGKPMIVSTGMNDIKAIDIAVNIMEKRGVSYALMHTTNLYPTDPRLVRLGAMEEMMEHFKGVPIGLSDHTLNNNSSIAAMTLGAKLIERHYTDVKSRTGPDIVCSMDEAELKDLINASYEIPLMLGGKKEACKEEQVTIDFAFATVVTIKDIKKGEIFTKDNLWVKRPGIGAIKAIEYESLLGKRASKDLKADTHISYDDILE